jgi:hypothetical protein
VADIGLEYAVFAVPAGSEAEIVNAEDAGAATTIERGTDRVWAGLPPSVTVVRRRERVARVMIVLNDLPKDTPQEDRACQPKPMQPNKEGRMSYSVERYGEKEATQLPTRNCVCHFSAGEA